MKIEGYRQVSANEIKVGLFLYMQNEPEVEHGFHEWGNIEEGDVARLKREISRGTCLWWVKSVSTTIKIEIPRSPQIKLTVIHGETEFFNAFESVEDLVAWAEEKKVFVYYFPVDVNAFPSFADCHSNFVVRPFYVGSFSKHDQKKSIRRILKSLPEFVRVPKPSITRKR